MTLADAAEQVLRNCGSPLTHREIASKAINQGIVSSKSDQPWLYIAAAIRKDNLKRATKGQPLRFSSDSSGRYLLL